jgi:DtxR family Mn-dependent transcriptional regulator
MDETRTAAEQDYLKAIFDLGRGNVPVTTSQLARHLGLSPASVTGMVQRLAAANPPLVAYRKHHGVELSLAGRREALRVVRHHRLIESFLHSSLGLAWDEVHVEAHRLEHAISPIVGERLAEALGEPTRDPHGDPIPDRELRLPAFSETPLSGVRPDTSVVVRRVDDSDPAFLRHAAELGLVPGVSLQVVDASPIDHLLRVRLEARAELLVLGPAISERVFVEGGG